MRVLLSRVGQPAPTRLHCAGRTCLHHPQTELLQYYGRDLFRQSPLQSHTSNPRYPGTLPAAPVPSCASLLFFEESVLPYSFPRRAFLPYSLCSRSQAGSALHCSLRIRDRSILSSECLLRLTPDLLCPDLKAGYMPGQSSYPHTGAAALLLFPERAPQDFSSQKKKIAKKHILKSILQEIK